jgi:hypothetical protein
MPTSKTTLREADPEWDRIQTWLESPACEAAWRTEYLRVLNGCNLAFDARLKPYWETPGVTHDQQPVA